MSMKKMRVRPSSILSVDKNDSTSEETEDRKWLERSDHPLMNHVILTRVFEHVRPYDLMVCRQVCKEWNVASLPQMRATFAVTIHGDKTSYSTKLEEGKGRRVSDFIKTFKSNVLGIPFEKYQLEPFQTTGRCGQQFLQLFGKSVKEIDLEGKGSGSENEYHGIEDVSEMLKSFLNLQDLKLSFQFVSRSKKIIKLFPDSHSDKPIQLSALQKINFCQDSLQQTRLKYCPTFIQELLMAAPNVVEIAVCDMNEEVEGRERVVVSDNTIVLDLIEKLRKESSIQSLALESATLNHIKILRTLAHQQPNGLKLKSLSFCPCPESNEAEDTPTIPIQLATIFKDTLEQFNVECASKNNLMEFPKMSKLKSLTLVDLEDFDPKYVDLNRMFPALQKLTIKFLPTEKEDDDEDEDEDEDGENDFFSQFEPCSNVEELCIHHATMDIHPSHQFLRVFPNLTKLNLQVRQVVHVENVREIWSRMIQLKSLSLQVSFEEMMNAESLDSLLTGIPTHTLQLKTIKNVVKKLNGMTEDVRNQNISRLRNEHSELPSIVNLKNLTHVKLSMNAWMGWDTKSRCRYLSDVTGYLALFPMAMDHLHHLEISECGFTRKCCEILTRNTQGTKLRSWRFENERKLIIPALSLRRD